MKISCIVAMAENNVIGNENQIPWYLPADLQYFKNTTLGHTVIMGRKCYESIGKPLPKRTNIIITRDAYFISSNCLIARSIGEALEMAHRNNEKEVFIIGGGQIYEQSKDMWDRLYITEVSLKVQGDILFPKINFNVWNMVREQKCYKDEKNEMDYTFKVYERK
jgi:dihydrofolate reductase